MSGREQLGADAPRFVLRNDGRVRHANAAAEVLFARPLSALIGRSFGAVQAPARVRVTRPSGPGPLADVDVTRGRWAGEAAWILTFSPLESPVAVTPAEERYALIARAANDGLWDWDLASGAVHYSPRWLALLGYDEQEIAPTSASWFDRVHADDVEHVRTALATHVAGEEEHFEHEFRMLHKHGGYRWVLCRGVAVRDARGVVTRLAGSLSDVTQRRLAEEQLTHRALYDPLTNLPNRALFLDRLRHAVRRQNRDARALFAVLFLDVDRFKRINDSLGHVAGDRLLVMVARRLELSLRPGDTVARLGGDEFTVLLDDMHSISDATHVADRIQEALKPPFLLGTHEVVTSASIGIALSATGYDKPEDMVRDADTAMYRAKSLGKARHALFDSGMHEQEMALLELEADLRRAIERSELVVHYQPIVSLASGRITGVEALARWRHPERGLVSPGEFIPLAEETGLIVPIGEFVLRESCRAVHEWGADDLFVSVNLSTRQLALPDLVERVTAVLAETGLAASRLRLEITESGLLEKPEAASALLDLLRRSGVRISIDDFGTGYSSLAYLQNLPVDNLKIDRSFVSPLGKNGEHSPIARTIVDIGHNLGMSVIAEGVETEEQLAHMRALACEGAQGHLFSRPLDAATALELIRAERRW